MRMREWGSPRRANSLGDAGDECANGTGLCTGVEAGLDIDKLAEVVSTICCDNGCVLTQRIDGRLLGC